MGTSLSRSCILVLDNSCYPQLASEETWKRFRANQRVADLVPAPSEVNLLEALAAPGNVQRRLLHTMKTLADGRPLLPWPFDLLIRSGEAILANKQVLELSHTGTEYYLDNPGEAQALQVRVRAFMQDLERRYSDLHANARIKIRRRMKDKGWGDSWEDAREFLVTQWHAGDIRAHFARSIWQALKLPGEAPVDQLLATPVWALMLDGEGVGVYTRAIARTQPKRVHRADLIQLVYLAAGDRGIIASNDKSFLAAATAVLADYPNTRAVAFNELIE